MWGPNGRTVALRRRSPAPIDGPSAWSAAWSVRREGDRMPGGRGWWGRGRDVPVSRAATTGGCPRGSHVELGVTGEGREAAPARPVLRGRRGRDGLIAVRDSTWSVWTSSLGPNYPFDFIRATRSTSAESFDEFDAILAAASPPAVRLSVKGLARSIARSRRELARADLDAQPTPRAARLGLRRAPACAEKRERAAVDPVRLCGSSFGLAVRRHPAASRSTAPMSGTPVRAPPARRSALLGPVGARMARQRLAEAVQRLRQRGGRSEWRRGSWASTGRHPVERQSASPTRAGTPRSGTP